MSDFVSHDGTVKTNETFSPGYVWFRCDAWGLPDNTTGKVGWHVIYRPLVPLYAPAGVTDEMRAATEKHYALACEAYRRQEEEAAKIEPVEEWRSPRGLTLTEEMDREDTIY